jgi:arylsulfatase A
MSTTQPNIIFILADDMGYGDLSCLNEQGKIQTQHLDRLAAAGLICRDAHATSAVCTPSRYSILTGRYNWRSALKQGVTWGYSPPLLEAERLTVAAFLQAQGYRTACVGKWHLGWQWAKQGPGDEEVDFAQPITHGPTSVGFDYFFGISASLDMPPYVYVENDRPTAVPDHIVPERDGKELLRAGPTAPDFVHEVDGKGHHLDRCPGWR